jgi:hypothetical protein
VSGGTCGIALNIDELERLVHDALARKGGVTMQHNRHAPLARHVARKVLLRPRLALQ